MLNFYGDVDPNANANVKCEHGFRDTLFSHKSHRGGSRFVIRGYRALSEWGGKIGFCHFTPKNLHEIKEILVPLSCSFWQNYAK